MQEKTNISDYPTITPESVWAAIYESDRLLKERIKEMSEERAEGDRLLKERIKEMSEERAEGDRLLKELERKILEERAEMAERDRLQKERERELSEERAERDRLWKEREKELSEERAERDRLWKEEMKEQNADIGKFIKNISDEYNRRMKKQEETMGAWSNNQGAFAEEYFFNSFENGNKTFFGENFDEIEKNAKGLKKGFKDEYDILLLNCSSVGIIEVKYKAHTNNIPYILKKAETFRVNFPDFENHKVYLGLASLAFYPELELECVDKGIAVIKQVGDTVVINDANLKVF